MRFYGRKDELELLERMDRNRPSFVVITARRRIGKTELMKKFISSRRFAYFFVDSNKTTGLMLSEYRKDLEKVIDIPSFIKFDGAEGFLEYIISLDEPVVIAFDEFQRFQKMDPSFITAFQKIWDLRHASSKAFIMISGPSIGMIRKIFMESGSPLFKRADNIITIPPFSVKDCYQVMEDIKIRDKEDMLDIYCMFGGIIFYYRLIEKYEARSFNDVLERLLLTDLAPLKNEVREILMEEFGKDHATYHEVLSAIAMGRCTKKEIGDVTHVEPTSLSPYLYDLGDILGMTEYVVPVTEDRSRSKKGRYFLKDNFFRFYYKFINWNMSDYQIGNFKRIKEEVRKGWEEHRGRIFEEIALQYFRERFSEGYDIGRYWDRKGNEIDVLGISRGGKDLLAVSVKAKDLSERDVIREKDALLEKVRSVFGTERKCRCFVFGTSIKEKAEVNKGERIAFDMEDVLS